MTLLKEFYFVAADDKFVKDSQPSKKIFALDSYKYYRPNIFPKPISFDKYAVPIVFQTSPDSLLNLAAKVVDSLPLPSVFNWQIEDICRWLRKYGYPQYQHTFRVNLINGRTLLLLDASALSAMNIKDFDHIRHISYGIRSLFYFEMTKFSRSISLAPEFHYELFKLFRVKNGTKYETTRRSELFRRMQLIRRDTTLDFREHWEILERWLKLEPDARSKELIGGVRRFDLYKCKTHVEKPVHIRAFKPCLCMPPCECLWTERELRDPWTLSFLPGDIKVTVRNDASVLSVLHNTFPERYRYYAAKSSKATYSGEEKTKAEVENVNPHESAD